MRGALEPSMYATDLAVEQAVAGVPFREAYRAAAEAAKTLADRTPEASLAARVSPGACADLRLDVLGARLEAVAGA
jgi:argininosuccinate lyase